MTTRICKDPADGLLPWYLNGTLDGEEAASVVRHLEVCAICSRKRDELAQIAAGLSAFGMPAAEARQARTSRLPYLLAAGLLLPAVLGLYWTYQGFPTNRELPLRAASAGDDRSVNTNLRSTVTLDLEAGQLRGGESVPVLRLTGAADWITVRFFMPAIANPRVAVSLETKAGEVLARQPGFPGMDELGRCAYSFSRRILPGPGEYDIVVHEESSPAGPRSHRFPFRVDTATPDGPGR